MTIHSIHFSINDAVRGNVKHIGYENHIFFQCNGFLGCLPTVVEKCQIFKASCCLSIYSSLKMLLFLYVGTCSQIM
jgi:hypothetical protein